MDPVGSSREMEKGKDKATIKMEDVVKLTMDLIDCESLSGYEQPMVPILKDWLEQRGWIVELQEVSPQKSTPNGKVRNNIYARRPDVPATRTEGPRVLFNSHIDTVRNQLYFPKAVVTVLQVRVAQAAFFVRSDTKVQY